MFGLKSDSKNSKSSAEDSPTGVLGEDYHSHELSNGKIVYFSYDSNNDDAKTLLTLYNSFKLTKDEINEFLNWLKYDSGLPTSSVNIDKVRNEIIWHNIGHALGVDYEATRTANVFFDSDDTGHGFFSWVMNHFRWW